jgi:hypothetical protein
MEKSKEKSTQTNFKLSFMSAHRASIEKLAAVPAVNASMLPDHVAIQLFRKILGFLPIPWYLLLSDN